MKQILLLIVIYASMVEPRQESFLSQYSVDNNLFGRDFGVSFVNEISDTNKSKKRKELTEEKFAKDRVKRIYPRNYGKGEVDSTETTTVRIYNPNQQENVYKNLVYTKEIKMKQFPTEFMKPQRKLGIVELSDIRKARSISEMLKRARRNEEMNFGKELPNGGAKVPPYYRDPILNMLENPIIIRRFNNVIDAQPRKNLELANGFRPRQRQRVNNIDAVNNKIKHNAKITAAALLHALRSKAKRKRQRERKKRKQRQRKMIKSYQKELQAGLKKWIKEMSSLREEKSHLPDMTNSFLIIVYNNQDSY